MKLKAGKQQRKSITNSWFIEKINKTDNLQQTGNEEKREDVNYQFPKETEVLQNLYIHKFCNLKLYENTTTTIHPKSNG